MVIPGLPHHETQRGNGCTLVFFSDADHSACCDWLGEARRAAGVAVWSWGPMPNHVPPILAPKDEDCLRRALAPLHRHRNPEPGVRRRARGTTAVASSSIFPGESSRSATKIMLMAG